MSVTIYVTEANFICYKGQKTGFFVQKTLFFPKYPKITKPQNTDYQILI